MPIKSKKVFEPLMVCPFAASANIETKKFKPSKTKGDFSMYEGRLAKIEVRVEHIEEDIRDIRNDIKSNFNWTLGLLGSGFVILGSGILGLAALMAHGFNWI